MKKLLACAILFLFSHAAFAELEGYYPRYVYIADDGIIGDTHYFGVAKFSKSDNTYDGYSFRYGIGEGGDRIGAAYTSGIWLMAFDFGVTYLRPDSDKGSSFNSADEGPAIEFGYRFFAIYANGIWSRDTSYITIGFGF